MSENHDTDKNPLEAVVSLFSGINPRPIKRQTIGNILKGIKSGFIRKKIEELRDLKKTDSEAYSREKKNLIAASIAGSYNYRNKEGLDKPSGFFHADIDHIPNLPQVRASIEKDPITAFCFLSPGGDGLKVGIRIDPTDLNAQRYHTYFRAIAKHFREKHQATLDEQRKDITGLCFLSYDPNTFIREDAEVFPAPADEPRKADEPNRMGNQAPANTLEAYCRSGLKGACDIVRNTRDGERNGNLNSQAFKVGQLVATGGLSLEEAQSALVASAMEAGLEQNEAIKTCLSGLNSGMKQPRKLSGIGHKAPSQEPPKDHQGEPRPNPQHKKTDSERLYEKFSGELEFFLNEDEPWVTIETNGVFKNFPVREPALTSWIIAESIKELGKTVSRGTAEKVQDSLLAFAQWINRTERKQVFTRLGYTENAIYLDVGDLEWKAIEIDSQGWRIVKKPPVKFRRAYGMKPLPLPIPGGRIEGLRTLINASQEEVWILALSWLVGALHPTGPYPILILQGEQGTAKTTFSRIIRDLIDPNKSSIRTVPRLEQDIILAASNSLVVAFDNLSGIPNWLSDACCRIATGGGFSSRKLYSDDGEVIFDVRRPQMLNGIDDVAHRGDLRSRALILNLEPIPEEDRRPEKEILAEFERLRPELLGALLTIVSTAMKNRGMVNSANLPRMADFARWIQAAEPALPWDAGQFERTYTEANQKAVETALEGSPVARVLMRIIEKRTTLSGSCSTILEHLNEEANEKEKGMKTWARDSIRLSAILKRISPELRLAGIEVHLGRAHKGRWITISRAKSKDHNSYDEDAGTLL
jgi:hypothetical protein